MHGKTASNASNVPPNFIALDASLIDEKSDIDIVREFIKLNRVTFIIQGCNDANVFNNVDLFEQCRALCDIENFDTMYDFTMQALVGKRLQIFFRDDKGKKIKVGDATVVDRYDDMRLTFPVLADFPIVMNWLVEFVAGLLGKKLPLPTENLGKQAAKRYQSRVKTNKTKTEL